MRTRNIIVTMAAAGSLALATVSCGVAANGDQTSQEPEARTVAAKTLVVKATPALQPVTVRQGGTVRITLPGNPSTGYDWQVAQGAAGYLKLVGEPTFKAESSLDGAPGMITYTFKALKAGDTVLVMKYAQPWEKDQPATETAAIAIRVVAKGDSPNVSVTLEKATASVTLKKGEALDIALPANPSTGYLWTPVGQKGDILAENGEGTFKAESGLVGAPGVYTLHLKAAKAGAQTLVLGYLGPGTAGTVDGAYALSVIVK
jgi:inhibitor of cysteine peptidase